MPVLFTITRVFNDIHYLVLGWGRGGGGGEIMCIKFPLKAIDDKSYPLIYNCHDFAITPDGLFCLILQILILWMRTWVKF